MTHFPDRDSRGGRRRQLFSTKKNTESDWWGDKNQCVYLLVTVYCVVILYVFSYTYNLLSNMCQIPVLLFFLSFILFVRMFSKVYHKLCLPKKNSKPVVTNKLT